jgi:hypothetical protein
MPQMFVFWKLNLGIQPPQDLNMQVAQTEGFLALMRHQLTDGSLKEVHAFLQGDSGYAISKETATEEQLYADLQAWQPWVTFEVHKTIAFPKGIEIVLEVQKARARMAQQQKAMA